MPSRPRNQPVLACARCYSLKKKCDKKLPCCSRCSLAGKECVAINRHSRKEVPRSALQYLEKRLAEIEGGRGRQPELEPQPQPQPQLELDYLPTEAETTISTSETTNVSAHAYRQILDAIGGSIRILYTTTCVGSHPGLLHESKLFYPTERPPHKVPVHGLYYEHLGKRAGYGNEPQFSGVDALSTPFEVARHIFDNYVNTILPRYPCFTSSELWYHFGQVYSRQQTSGASSAHFSRFVVSMVLAVSCLASRNEDFARVASMSESLYRDAMRHWTFLRQSNIKSLQGLLLLIQLGFLLPYINNVFYLSGEAGRMAVGLGLHQEPDPVQGLSSRDVSLRRQIFWMVYLIDRTIAISTGSPPNVSDEHITVGLPNCSNVGIHAAEAFPSYTEGGLSAKYFVLQIQHCQLQSEIYEIKFFGRAVPDKFSSYADWVENTEERIRSMLNLSVASNNNAIPQWITNDAYQSQNLLHRPHPGSMAPSQSSLLAATTSAISLIDGYHKTFQTQRLAWTFAVVNNTFQAAIVLLYIFGNYASNIREASLENELLSALDTVMAILNVGTQRWPVIAVTSMYVRDLREFVFSNPSRSTGVADDLRHLEELELLLSQRRIRSIYQANSEIQPSLFLPAEFLSPAQEASQLPFSDDMWQEFMGAQFDLEEAFSHNFLELPLLAEQQQILVADTTELTDTASRLVLPDDIKGVIDSMPSCSFCRDQHVRCDRELPCCGACSRSRRDCVYHDILLSQEIPRRNIHSLIQKLVIASQPRTTPQKMSSTSPPVYMAASLPTWGSNVLIPASASSKDGVEKSQGGSTTSIWTTNTDYIFFGVSSPLASITSLAPLPTNPRTAAFGHESSAIWIRGSFTSTAQIVGPPDISTTLRLFTVFSRSVHVWYPIMNDESLQSLLSCHRTEPLDSCLDQKHELFYLILAISSLLTKRAEPLVNSTPAAYFNRATSNTDTSCDHSSGPGTLHMMQRSLLICIYLLLSPGSGDIWRNLGFAIRLYFDMSHGRSQNISLDEAHHTMLSRTLYCIEGNVTTAFGRPTVLAIGDGLRYELTSPVCNTVEERISIQFYRISTIKMQLQSLLSATTVQHNPARLKERCQNIHKKLLEWHQYWKTDFVPAITSERYDWGGAVQYFEAWGSLQYNASVLMISRFSPETTEYIFDTAREIVSCSAILVRHSQRSSCAILDDETHYKVPVFPTDWTVSHLLFAAALHLLSSEKQSTAGRATWQRTVRSCLTTLALMEADPANLSMGFSDIIEELCNRHDQHT